VPVIPYSADAIQHVTAWRTNVMQSLSGKEQRISLLDRPRESLELELVMTDAEAAAVRAELYADPMATYEVPLRFEDLPIQAITSGSHPVAWQNVTGATAADDGTLTKTAGIGWTNSGASSVQTITSGVAGFVEYTIQAGVFAVVGLSNGDASLNYTEIDFGLYTYPTTGTIYVAENGAFPSSTTYLAGDTIRVSVSSGGTVTYQKNGVTFYTSAGTPTYPLRVDSSLYSVGAQIADVVINDGKVEITVDGTAVDWVAAAGRVFVDLPDGTWHAGTIEAVNAATPAATRITLAETALVAEDISAALARLAPLLEVHLDPDQALARRRDLDVDDAMTEARWSLRALAPAFRATWGTGATLTTFDSFNVLTEIPVAFDLVQEQASSGAEILDAGSVIDKERTWTASTIRRAHDFEVDDEDDRQWWRKFLATVRGRWLPFLLPTWRRDLAISAGSSAGGDTLDVTSTDLIGLAGFDRVQIAYADGTIDYHTIVTATDNLDGTHTIEFSPVFSGDITNDDDATISWLEVVRLDADAVAWTWREGMTAALSLAFWIIQEDGDATSSPREVYELVADGRTYRYTTAARAVTYAAQTYEPLAGLVRTEPGLRPLDPQDVTITMPRSATFVTENAYGIPPGSMAVTITRVEEVSGTGVEIWQGQIASISIAGKLASFRVPHFLDSAARTQIPAVYCQPSCPHQLYDDRCGVLRTSHDVATTVSTISADGRTITVASIGGNADQWARGGELVVRAGAADEERRTILDQVGAVLLVQHGFRDLDVSDSVTVYAGCDRLPSTCNTKFTNIANFGGFQYAPKIAGGWTHWLDPREQLGGE